MRTNFPKTGTRSTAILALWLAAAFVLRSISDTASARRGGSDHRVRFYGIIESRPYDGYHGTWVIGGSMVTTGPGTRFDELQGPLVVGSCVKVDIRNGHVHEIDSEPFGDCQSSIFERDNGKRIHD